MADCELCVQARARVARREAATTGGPEICNSWDWLPEGILREIALDLDLRAVRAMRLTCQRWRVVMDRNAQALRLSKAKIHNVIAQFPAVQHLDMSGAASPHCP